MFIPYGTDASLNHRPYVTVGLIVINLVLAIVLPREVREQWALTLGDGLHPLQWVTHNFIHTGWWHAFGSMFMLWVFGLVVEGKAGPYMFLAAYLVIGVVHGATVQYAGRHVIPQIVTMGSEACVSGMVGLAVVWVPVNCIRTLWAGRTLFAWFAETYEIRIGLFAFGEVVWNIVSIVMLRHIGGMLFLATIAGNLSCLVWGFVIGSIMLQVKLVDCEGWDVYRVLTRRAGRIEAERKKTRRRGPRTLILRERMVDPDKKKPGRESAATSTPKAEPKETSPRSIIDRLYAKLNDNDIGGAMQLYGKTAGTLPYWPDETETLALIKALHGRNLMAESIPVMRDYCRNYPRSADRIRLKLAQVHILNLGHPARGLRVLAEIAEGSLPESLEETRLDLKEQAERMLEEGVLEREEDE